MPKPGYYRDLSDTYSTRWSSERTNPYKFTYRPSYGRYHRSVRTQNELRQLICADADGLPVRRKRLNLPTAYDDLNVCRRYGKSWKDYTKRRKQWETR